MTLSNQQVIDLIRQLPPLPRRTALLSLAQKASRQQDERMAYAETQLRQLCTQRGFDWDALSEDKREAFIDTLLHEE